MQDDTPNSSGNWELASRRIGQLLDHEQARIRRRFLIHGAGVCLVVFVGGVLSYYLIDRALDLPSAVRVLLTIACVGYLLVLLRRRIAYPMSRSFARDDVALAIERQFPDLRQKLISALQLSAMMREARENPKALRNQSAPMIEEVVADAALDTGQLELSHLLDGRKTRRAWLAAGMLATISLLGAAADPVGVGVFVQRVFGLSAVYPRLTRLIVELPPDSPEFRVERHADDHATITIAAGAELPVLVSVEGLVPREVGLAISGGRGMPSVVSMTARQANRFRYMFRRVQSGFSFHAFGGDDPTGNMTVDVVTESPPRVSTISAALTYPSYTGKAPEDVEGGSIEALIGTNVDLTVTSTVAAANATLEFIDSGATLELQPTTIRDDSGEVAAFAGTFQVDASDRYQITLESPDGLRNPHPGTYPIIALEDHAPVGQMLSPTGDDLNAVLPGGSIPVRFDVGDDFGLVLVTIKTETARTETVAETPAFEGPPARTEAVLTQVLEVAALGGGTPLASGDSIAVSGVLTDNRTPEAQQTDLPTQRIHVVDEADLARRIAGHFRRIREDVEKAVAMQEDRRDRTQDVREELSTGAKLTELGGTIRTIEIGQGRVMSTSGRVHRELMRSFNVHLFNRLEGPESTYAPRVLELYVQYHRAQPEREAMLPGFYRMLGTERAEGRIGAMEKALDPLLEMIGRADTVATKLSPEAVRLLESAGLSTDATRVGELLAQAETLQNGILSELTKLRERLAEWNEFQDVIFETRSLRDKQKDVLNRTGTLKRGPK